MALLDTLTIARPTVAAALQKRPHPSHTHRPPIASRGWQHPPAGHRSWCAVRRRNRVADGSTARFKLSVPRALDSSIQTAMGEPSGLMSANDDRLIAAPDFEG